MDYLLLGALTLLALEVSAGAQDAPPAHYRLNGSPQRSREAASDALGALVSGVHVEARMMHDTLVIDTRDATPIEVAMAKDAGQVIQDAILQWYGAENDVSVVVTAGARSLRLPLDDYLAWRYSVAFEYPLQVSARPGEPFDDGTRHEVLVTFERTGT